MYEYEIHINERSFKIRCMWELVHHSYVAMYYHGVLMVHVIIDIRDDVPYGLRQLLGEEAIPAVIID